VKPGLLVVSDDAGWVRRLAGAACGLGLEFAAARNPRALPGPAGGAGVAVVDWASGAPAVQARRWAEAVRRQLPCYALAFAAERGGLAADAVARALAHGADGVVAKDASSGGLAAQLRALCRRAAAAARERGLLSSRGGLRFDPERGRILFPGRGRWRPGPGLSPKEAGLLRLFLEHPGRILERAGLLEAVWGGRGGDVNVETLDKQVAALRRKLGAQGRALRTVRGRGYRWL
jgi:DNA-binding response OmpR family regulator